MLNAGELHRLKVNLHDDFPYFEQELSDFFKNPRDRTILFHLEKKLSRLKQALNPLTVATVVPTLLMLYFKYQHPINAESDDGASLVTPACVLTTFGFFYQRQKIKSGISEHEELIERMKEYSQLALALANSNEAEKPQERCIAIFDNTKTTSHPSSIHEFWQLPPASSETATPQNSPDSSDSDEDPWFALAQRS